jgi:hypothetical protein
MLPVIKELLSLLCHLTFQHTPLWRSVHPVIHDCRFELPLARYDHDRDWGIP